ncbi:MAG: hypothetical protein HWN65_18435 [Candidatus Helarchaeota archaeon]|nr:hypothetical protein [Candidatus Helarchaeota archaeon]
MGFIGDLLNKPEAAIVTIEEKQEKGYLWKTLVLFAITGMFWMANFFLFHLAWSWPEVMVFFFTYLSYTGIIALMIFVIGFLLELFIILKLIGFKPIGKTLKTISWCVLIPALIYSLCLTLINTVLVSIGMSEIAVFLYDYLKYILYIWILALSIVVVSQHQPEHKLRNSLGVMSAFWLNYAVNLFIVVIAVDLLLGMII